MDFAAYWQYTDLVTKALFFLLLLLSVLSWITGILRIIGSMNLAKNVSNRLHLAIAPFAESDAVAAQQNGVIDTEFAERKTLYEQTLLQQIGRCRYQGEKGLSILGTIAAVAPFIGLFGTVWGIFHALHNIGESGQAGLGQVAGPVGEALIMTGLGLAVAIPAVVFYNVAMRLNRKTLFVAHDTAYALLQQPGKTSNSSVSRSAKVLSS